MDRKIETIFDLDDAMKVQTSKRSGDRNREATLAITTPSIPEYFFALTNCSITCERAERMAIAAWPMGFGSWQMDDKVKAIDIGDAWWQDVDTPEMRAARRGGVAPIGGIRPEEPSLRS